MCNIVFINNTIDTPYNAHPDPQLNFRGLLLAKGKKRKRGKVEKKGKRKGEGKGREGEERKNRKIEFPTCSILL